MKNFLAIYLGTPASFEKSEWATLTDTQRRERERRGIEAWNDWARSNQASIVDGGAPIGKTKCASAKGVADGKNTICAYSVVRAESHEAAAKLFENHPHFTIFPGDAVEIMECLPTPQA